MSFTIAAEPIREAAAAISSVVQSNSGKRWMLFFLWGDLTGGCPHNRIELSSSGSQKEAECTNALWMIEKLCVESAAQCVKVAMICAAGGKGLFDFLPRWSRHDRGHCHSAHFYCYQTVCDILLTPPASPFCSQGDVGTRNDHKQWKRVAIYLYHGRPCLYCIYGSGLKYPLQCFTQHRFMLTVRMPLLV